MVSNDRQTTTMEWKELRGNWILMPPQPKGIVHFLGGAFIAAAPNETYKFLLEELAKAGYLVIATSFISTLDHQAVAEEIHGKFELAMEELLETGTLRRPNLPVYGIGHSLGCKMQLMLASMFSLGREGNIFLAYNNYPVKKSVPFLDLFLDQISPFMAFDVEFKPSPQMTLDLVDRKYHIKRNLLVKFRNDEIDETMSLKPVLQNKYPESLTIQVLGGNHLTPLWQDIKWPVSQEFSPLDALGQWVRQNAGRDAYRLRDEILRWMDPLPWLKG